MERIVMTLAALLLLTVAGYAQYRLPFHVEGRGKTAAARAVLAAIGAGFGIVTAASYVGDTGNAVLGFMIGFGMVHVPAAVILFLKRARGEGRS